jgi:desulfoferrodoxin-like iron-binding protein
MNAEYSEAEWGQEEWKKAWNVRVGKAYGCEKCGAMVMVTKGGTGVLELACCGQPMVEIEARD